MTNFEMVVKKYQETVIDILSRAMCFDSNGEIISAFKWHDCYGCKCYHEKNCQEEIKKWLNEEVEGKDCENCEYFDVDPLEEPCSSCKDRSNWKEGEVKE